MAVERMGSRFGGDAAVVERVGSIGMGGRGNGGGEEGRGEKKRANGAGFLVK